MEKLRVSEENLTSENVIKEKKESKLQIIEKELQEIKKLTGLKEVIVIIFLKYKIFLKIERILYDGFKK